MRQGHLWGGPWGVAPPPLYPSLYRGQGGCAPPLLLRPAQRGGLAPQASPRVRVVVAGLPPHMGQHAWAHWGWVVRLALGQSTTLLSHVGPILLWAPLLDPSRTF